MQTNPVGGGPQLCAADGADIWVANGAVVRVEGNTGKVLGTWTGPLASFGLVIVGGRVVVVDNTYPGNLYVIDPR